jgi:hypothetical protein
LELLKQSSGLSAGPCGSTTAHEWHSNLVQAFCLDNAQHVAEFLKGKSRHLVIGFDKCHHHNQAHDNELAVPNANMSLIALQRIIKDMDFLQNSLGNIKLCCTLLDTSLSVFDLVPQKGKGPLLCLASSMDPLPACSCLGFNQMVPTGIIGMTPAQDCYITSLQKYG